LFSPFLPGSRVPGDEEILEETPPEGAQRFRRLAGSRKEGERLAALLRVEPWLGSEALKSRVMAVRAPRILHLAVPGFFLGNPQREPSKDPAPPVGGLTTLPPERRWENPLRRAGLALAGANAWTDPTNPPPETPEGLLTAKDVSSIDLVETELVVLSACDTLLGAAPTGHNVIGLQRSFVLAGAQTLIMSRWRVPDKQRQELLSDFYTRVLAGQPRIEALREAQLALKARYPDPLYWGAFICHGDPRTGGAAGGRK
jgi:hypothetical protein